MQIFGGRPGSGGRGLQESWLSRGANGGEARGSTPRFWRSGGSNGRILKFFVVQFLFAPALGLGTLEARLHFCRRHPGRPGLDVNRQAFGTCSSRTRIASTSSAWRSSTRCYYGATREVKAGARSTRSSSSNSSLSSSSSRRRLGLALWRRAFTSVGATRAGQPPSVRHM